MHSLRTKAPLKWCRPVSRSKRVCINNYLAYSIVTYIYLDPPAANLLLNSLGFPEMVDLTNKRDKLVGCQRLERASVYDGAPPSFGYIYYRENSDTNQAPYRFRV